MEIKKGLKKLKDKLLGNQHETTNSNEITTVTTSESFTEEEKRMLDDIKHFREGDISPAAKNIVDYFASIRSISLNAKVDDFIDWFYKNMVKGQYTALGEYHRPIELRNFIEKMAVWYELRYPDYEINRLMPGSGQEGIEINDVMFRHNLYINEVLDIDSDAKELDWAEFYNAKAFINSLPWEERYIFQKPRHRDVVYIDPSYKLNSHTIVAAKTAHLHLNSNGIVQESEGLGEYTNYKVNDDELKGMHIKKVVELLKEKNISLPSDNELEATVNNAEKILYQKEGVLDCVMYRIIERGGERMGPRRAFLFAQEFGRNIDIPMMYGVDYSDPGLRKFVNEYIKAGGSKDLMCYIGYFTQTGKLGILKTVSVQELIKKVHNDCATKYTEEETELHQRMVNTLTSQINQEELEKEGIKQSRLQRKLQKSKNTKW